MTNEDFFRHCWLTLKKSKPRLRRFMDEIECAVEGAGKIAETKLLPRKEAENKTNDSPKPPEEAPYVTV